MRDIYIYTPKKESTKFDNISKEKGKCIAFFSECCIVPIRIDRKNDQYYKSEHIFFRKTVSLQFFLSNWQKSDKPENYYFLKNKPKSKYTKAVSFKQRLCTWKVETVILYIKEKKLKKTFFIFNLQYPNNVKTDVTLWSSQCIVFITPKWKQHKNCKSNFNLINI